jgi:hypothetical protein
MKKTVAIAILAVVVSFAVAPPGQAWADGFRRHPRFHSHSHSRVVIGFGPRIWWGPAYRYPYYPYYPYYSYYPYYPAYVPPPVVVQEPPVYIQQTPPAASLPPEAYWYYCPSAGAYYPTAPSCTEEWVKVPAQTPPDTGR